MTVVTVNGGACGFLARIRTTKLDKQSLRIEIESECEFVQELSRVFGQNGPLTLQDILGTSEAGNPVFREASLCLPHSACPVRIAVLKAAEVELGLNVPCDISIEFERIPQ